MNKVAIIEELYDEINNHGLIETIGKVFGKGCKIEIGCTTNCCSTTINELDLSVRSYNALMRSGFKTVENVINAINENSLIKIRNLGLKSIAEIRMLILEYSYSCLNEKNKKLFIEKLVDLNCL